MTHPADDDLVLHFYRDAACPAEVAAHLAACTTCAARYRDLASLLEAVPGLEVPARGEHYGLEVWQRIRPILPNAARLLTRGVSTCDINAPPRRRGERCATGSD